MLGGEGTGLKPDLQRKADYLVSISGQRSGQGGVDSLNVSVAAGLLAEVFLRRPMSPTKDVSDERARVVDGKEDDGREKSDGGELF